MFTNISAKKRFARANVAAKTLTTTHIVAVVFATATLATQAATSGVPSNPSNPSVPTSTTVVKNTYPYAVNVSITGGTVTVIKVNGTTTGLTSGNFVVPSGGTISITYSAAPTWVWTNADGSVGWVYVLCGTTIRKVSVGAN